MTDDLERKLVFKTDLPPCSLRINPHDPTIIYLGTYKLVEGSNRFGSIEIWKHNEIDNTVSKVKDIPTESAILDLKFDPFSFSREKLRLISVHSKGNIMIWEIDLQDGLSISLCHEEMIYDEDTLITAANFHKLEEGLITLSTTTGICSTINLMDFKTKVDFDTQHSLECWYSEFGGVGGLEKVVFSGGDDRKLIAHDMRMKISIFETDRLHDAGIVSILTASDDWCKNVSPYAMWTGSYDDTLKNIDLRVGKPMDLINGVPPRCKESLELGGGVWKLIPSPQRNDNRVLSCNMYDGGRILSYNRETSGNVIVDKSFKGDHESICYGGDWVGDKLVTCSFYDKVVQVWKL